MKGDRLKKLRTNKKMTQSELGEKVNVTKVSISGYENSNRSPDTDTLQKLADFFDVSTDYLLGRTDIPNIDSPPTLNTWLRQENTDLSESEKDELSNDIEDYLAMRKQRILDKRNGK